MQRQAVVSSDSTEQAQSDNNDGILQQAGEANSLAPVFALGKVNRLLMTYVDKPVTPLDKRLLKGFYVADKKELCNDSEQESQRYMSQANFGQSKDLLQMVSTEKAQDMQDIYERWRIQKERRQREALIEKSESKSEEYSDSGVQDDSDSVVSEANFVPAKCKTRVTGILPEIKDKSKSTINHEEFNDVWAHVDEEQDQINLTETNLVSARFKRLER